MGSCVKCGKETRMSVSGIGYLCKECREVEKQNRIIEKSKTLTRCSDFKTWDHGDMSEFSGFILADTSRSLILRA